MIVFSTNFDLWFTNLMDLFFHLKTSDPWAHGKLKNVDLSILILLMRLFLLVFFYSVAWSAKKINIRWID